jgi:membrane dipeptidase
MLTFDAHLDLSLNALGGFNRDLRLPVHEIRRREAGMTGKGRACGTTAFPEMRKGTVGICVATQLAGCMPGVSPIANWMSPEQAWAETQVGSVRVHSGDLVHADEDGVVILRA